MRSALAIAAGFVAIAVVSFAADALVRLALPADYDASGRVTDVPVLLLLQALVGVVAVAGCALTARLAPSAPMRHALVLGGLGLAVNLAGSAAMWETAPAWYHVLGWGLTMPYAWLGGRLGERFVARGAVPIGV